METLNIHPFLMCSITMVPALYRGKYNYTYLYMYEKIDCVLDLLDNLRKSD